MAGTRAVEAVCNAVVDVLRDATPKGLEIQVTSDLQQLLTQGVSLFVYRIVVDRTQRMPGGGLPLELHFLLTAWGRDAAAQNAVAGWMMRALEDTPLLGADRLGEDVFGPDEAVEVVAAELDTADLLRLWAPGTYRLSVPYLARGVRIDAPGLSGRA
jgi:hypothetical protein